MSGDRGVPVRLPAVGVAGPAGNDTSSALVPPPLSLYVHLPWCLRKCPYCDFNSHGLTAGEAPPEQDYVDALLADLESELPAVWGRAVTTVFLGGGTPSLFSPQSIQRLLSGIRARVTLRPGAEVTMEVNPGAADSARLAEFADAGVNRFSVGVQSFDDELLRRLGRVHDASAAEVAVAAALASGAVRVNLDLMFALPGQDRRRAGEDVARALATGVGHVSYYQLTLEPNTAFHRDPPPLPEHDVAFAMFEQGRGMLADAGLLPYEVSAYARESQRCQHNLNVWRFGDYLGIGAGAHGKITLAASAEVLRTVKHRHPRHYLEGVARGDASQRRDAVNPRDLTFEFLLNGLRLREGVRRADFPQRTGLPLTALESAIAPAARDGLLHDDGQRVWASPRGERFLDDLLADLLP
jgi:oxygen-independent coproporphyrinogen-3 oxidase